MKIQNKMLLTICSVVVLTLVGQILFNLFCSKGFFLWQQGGIIKEAYYKIKTQYDNELENVNFVAENLQDTYGIKTVVLKNAEVIYSSGYSMMMQGQRPGMNVLLHKMEFMSEPIVTHIQGQGKIGDAERLQLAGKFNYEDDEIFVLLTLQVASIDNSIAVFTEANIYISIIVLIIGVLIAQIVSKTISAPIMNIENASKKIAEMDFTVVADESSSTIELTSLAQNMNRMSKELEKSMQELSIANAELQKDIEYRKQLEGYRREFIASVSHEMKTPLALLQIYTENLKNNVEGIDKDYYCDTIIEETQKLNKMVSNMLEIASIDSGFIKLVFEEVDISELCKDILREYQPILESYHTEISISKKAMVLGDIKYLEQVFKNLLNNAIQHTPKGGNIQIGLSCVCDKVVFEVFNQGDNIPENDLEHVWDAFYRTDKARTHGEKNNVGLGLYIVKTVIDKHDGICCIENRENGVSVRIMFQQRSF